MLDRLKNLWELSGMSTKVVRDEATGETKVVFEVPKPKGMATVVDMEDDIKRDFPAGAEDEAKE